MKFAYADPPYIGCSKSHYGSDPSGIQAREVNMRELVAKIDTYDAWALSTHSPGLQTILPFCVGVRVGAWVKPFASFKPGVNPAYAWEPVIFKGARKRTRADRTIRDWVSVGITLETGTHGAKPKEFCFWLFDLMGLVPDDELVDLYPGSGAVQSAWQVWSEYRRRLPRCDVADEIENQELCFLDAKLKGGDGK